MNSGRPGFGPSGRVPAGPDPRPTAVAALALCRQLTTLAAGMQAAASAFPRGTFSWRGQAAELMSGVLASKPERFQAVATACARAATALSAHADRLGAAAWLRDQAADAPVFLADELIQRAAAMAAQSALEAAESLLALARAAPARQSRLSHWLGKFNGWRSEILVGAAQSTEQIAGTALGAVRLATPYSPKSAESIESAWSGVVRVIHHPGQAAKTIIDWHTWQTNPPRAVGHLLPDLVIALGSGGLGAGSKAAETISRTQAAVRAAAAGDLVRRQATAATAQAAREALVSRALSAADRQGSTAWLGDGGTTLSARQNASVELFHALSAARERSITRALGEVSRTAQAELAGLAHRIKAVESLKRKLATAQGAGGESMPALLTKANDTVRYTVVIDDDVYVDTVPQVAAELEKRGFHHLSPPNNAWHSGRYRGINTSWLDSAGGAAFEVQFHTPASWRITKLTHSLYEESRLPNIDPELKAELQAQIAQAYRAAPIPVGVEALTGSSLPPPTVPAPIVPPPNYTLYAAISGGTAAQLLAAQHSSVKRPN